MDTIRMGIIGSGEMGRIYSEGLTKYNRGVRLAAITGGTRAKGLAAEYGVDHEPNLDSLLERKDIDAVLVGTPHDVHAQQVIAAAEHGKHVLVEKPMALSVADCDAMIDACRKANVTLSVVKTFRYWGTIRRAKQLVDEHIIGRVLMIQNTTLSVLARYPKDWWYTPESGGSLFDIGSHIFDCFRWFTGDEPTTIYGHARSVHAPAWHGMSTMVQVQFSKGVSAQSWMSYEMQAPGFPNTRPLLRIWGEYGLIDCDGYGQLRLSTCGGPWEDIWKRPTSDRWQEPLHPARVEPFQLNTQDFVDGLREGRPPTVSGEDGRAAVEMVQATYLSSQTGSSVRLPLPSAKGGFQFDGATVPRDRIPG